AKPQLSGCAVWAGAPDSVSVTDTELYEVLSSRYLICPLSCSIWPVIWPIWFCTAMMSLMFLACASRASIALRCASALARRALKGRDRVRRQRGRAAAGGRVRRALGLRRHVRARAGAAAQG